MKTAGGGWRRFARFVKVGGLCEYGTGIAQV